MKASHISGKRKSSIAKATVKDGHGIVRINKILLENYSNEVSRMKVMEPLLIAGDLSKKVNVIVSVAGGGFQSQAEAARLAIARALVNFSKDKALRQAFLDYDRHLLIADVRAAETSKPNDSKPRAKRQKSYR